MDSTVLGIRNFMLAAMTLDGLWFTPIDESLTVLIGAFLISAIYGVIAIYSDNKKA